MITSKIITSIQLNLTLEQAFYLRRVLWNVGGSPKGPRGLMDEICTELGKYGKYLNDIEYPPGFEIQGTVSLDIGNDNEKH